MKRFSRYKILILCVLACMLARQMAAQPNWTVNPANYQFSMIITAQLMRDSVPDPAPGNQIAAYVGDELRGVATATIIGGQAYYFLTVYAHTFVSDTLTFRAYVAAENLIFTSADSVAFKHHAHLGKIAEPYPLYFGPPPPMFISAIPTAVLCNGATGKITVPILGGVSPYDVVWDGPGNNDGVALNQFSGYMISNIPAGTYSITVTDENGVYQTTTATLTEPTAISLQPTPTNVLCHGETNGSILLTVNGGNPGYTYDWSNDGPEDPDNDAASLNNLAAGTYTVTVTDANGCPMTASTTITEPAAIELSSTVLNPSSCLVMDGAINLSVAGGTPVYTFDWSNDGPETPDNDAQNLLNITVGTYTVTVTDNNGCSATHANTLTFSDSAPPSITCPPNTTLAANTSCAGALGAYTPATLIDNCTINPALTQTPAAGTILTGHNTVQTVTLTATDASNNSASCTFSVTLLDVSPPSIVCPANQTVAADVNCSGVVGAYNPVSVLDNCSAEPVVTQSPAAGALLNGHNDVETVTLTANDGNGNLQNCTFTVTLKDITLPLLTCPPNLTLALDATCFAVVGTYSPAAMSDNCTAVPTATQSPLPGAVISGHNHVETLTLTADDTHGNTRSCSFTITLLDVTKPLITCPANQIIPAGAACEALLGTWNPLSLSDNCTVSPTLTQSPSATTVLSGHNDVEAVILTANDGHGNTETCSFNVTLKDLTAPAITCPANTTLTVDANCSATIGTYSALSLSDNCTAGNQIVVVQNPLPNTTVNGSNLQQLVTLTATDLAGNANSCSLTISLLDQIKPAITCPANTTLSADANCSGLLGAWPAVSVGDNCSVNPAVTQTPVPATVLNGHNDVELVTLTATDASGNTQSCQFSVTLIDVVKPLLTCPANLSVAADFSCRGVVGSQAPLAVSDNCSAGVSVVQSPAASTILIGHNDLEVVTFTATDAAGNSQTCTFTVTLKDVTAPTVVCKNATVNLNAAGTASITAISVFQSGADNCGTVSPQSVTPSAFNCSNFGANTVTLIANDGFGNTASCTATVTVVDAIAPTMLCRPATVTLNAQGQGVLTPAQVNNGSFDNCSIVTLTVTPSVFTCAQIGANTVQLDGIDQSSNKGTCTATVTVVDPILPMAKCKNAIVNLGANGSVVLAPTQVNNNSTDNCSFNLTVTPATFTCANIGLNTVTLRATDSGGNFSTCTAAVTIKDVSGPTALCKNATVFLNNTGQGTLTVAQVDNGSVDNCGIATKTLSQTNYSCAELGGPWLVTLTLKDASNNTSTCTANVTVKDAMAPTAVCSNTTVKLSQSGSVTVYGANLAVNSFDNCAVWTYTPSAKVYTTANIGNNNLTITVKDFSNNAATCVSVVTVQPFSSPNEFQTGGENTGKALDAIVGMSIFPNPTDGIATLALDLPAEQPCQLRVFDLAGRLVYDHAFMGVVGENQLEISLEGYFAGVYLVDFQSEGFFRREKLLLQR